MTVIEYGNLTIDEGRILRTHLAILPLVRTSTGVLRLIRAYRNYSYRRTSATATGVYTTTAATVYANFFTA